MEETIGKANLRDAAIGTGIAVDKMLALTGQMPVGVQVAVVNMPTPEQNEERRRAHHALDKIARPASETRATGSEGRTHDTNAASRLETGNADATRISIRRGHSARHSERPRSCKSSHPSWHGEQQSRTLAKNVG